MGLETLGTYVKSLKLIFTKEGLSQLGGFGSLGTLFPETWDWARFWNMTGFLSIILAFMNIIPIPGASGTAEMVFLAVFGSIFNENLLTSTMLVWRMFSYFIHIIVGFIVFIFMLNYKKKRINSIQ